jgi:hypothetical protein
MIFALAFLTKWMIPAGGAPLTEWYHISPGEAGAWVGTSEYADAAGFAVVAELAADHGDAPIHAFTLMKVIGRDIWIGIWAFVLSIVSVTFWERRSQTGEGPQGRVGISVIWERFPKFVLGFFAASVIMSLIAASPPEDAVGGRRSGTFKSKAQQAYDADFSGFRLRRLWPTSSPTARRRDHLPEDVAEELNALAAQADEEQTSPEEPHPSPTGSSQLETWSSARSRSSAPGRSCCASSASDSPPASRAGQLRLKPFWAFTISVLVNVPSACSHHQGLRRVLAGPAMSAARNQARARCEVRLSHPGRGEFEAALPES